MTKNKKLLLIAATHGDEKIGVEVIERLNNEGYQGKFDYLIANSKALKKNIRFIDADLNRSYPGEKNSPFYEKRKAYDNLKLAKEYQYIIDIHETGGGISDFIIVPREKISKLFPLQFIDLKKAVLWPDPKGSISQVLDNAIELEFVMKNRNKKEVIAKAANIIEKFLAKVESNSCSAKLDCDVSNKEIYYVYGELLTNGKICSDSLRNFEKIKIDSEEFYPLLVGQYLKEGIVCYKMRKIS